MEIVKPENLKLEQFITVSKWTETSNIDYVGDILQVLKIDLPYIKISSDYTFWGSDLLDVRKVEIGVPTKESIEFYHKEEERIHEARKVRSFIVGFLIGIIISI